MIDAPVDTVDGFVRARPHARCVRAPQNAVTTNTRSSSVTLPDGRRQLQPQSPPMLGTFASTVGRTPLSRFKPHNSTASAANASGFVQTALSRVTRQTIFAFRSTTSAASLSIQSYRYSGMTAFRKQAVVAVRRTLRPQAGGIPGRSKCDTVAHFSLSFLPGSTHVTEAQHFRLRRQHSQVSTGGCQ